MKFYRWSGISDLYAIFRKYTKLTKYQSADKGNPKFQPRGFSKVGDFTDKGNPKFSVTTYIMTLNNRVQNTKCRREF